MVLSLQLAWIFLLSAARCNEILAFRTYGIQPQIRQLINKQKLSHIFVYDPENDYEFESVLEAPTSGSTGVYGGDFAGLAATFNPGDGSFIPIPEYLIPDELIEWGQEPKCLEVLVSEDIIHDKTGEEYVMTRVTTTILPSTGCSVDNLETTLAKDEIDLESQFLSIDNDGQDLGEIVGLQYPLGNERLRTETIFSLNDEEGVDRIRVVIDLIPSFENFAIKSPMMLMIERQTSPISSGGRISEGGGLDARSIYRLLGDRLRRDTILVDKPLMSYDDVFCDNYAPKNDTQHVNIARNISIAYGWLEDRNSWMLQVCHITQDGMRRVISRQFAIAKDGELDFEIRSWVEDTKEGIK